jgi:hypothetical protein
MYLQILGDFPKKKKKQTVFHNTKTVTNLDNKVELIRRENSVNTKPQNVLQCRLGLRCSHVEGPRGSVICKSNVSLTRCVSHLGIEGAKVTFSTRAPTQPTFRQNQNKHELNS